MRLVAVKPTMEQPTEHDDRERKVPVEIFVNTRKVETDEKTLDYDQVVKIAFPDGQPGTNYTVAYRKGEDHKEGFLVKGGPAVKVKDGMIFDVSPTTES